MLVEQDIEFEDFSIEEKAARYGDFRKSRENQLVRDAWLSDVVVVVLVAPACAGELSSFACRRLYSAGDSADTPCSHIPRREALREG